MPLSKSGFIYKTYSIFETISRLISVRLCKAFKKATNSEKSFIKANKDFWTEIVLNNTAPQGSFVFVHYELYPLALIGNLHIASTLAKANNAEIVLIAPSYFDKASKEVIKSFPNVTIEYEDTPRYLLYRVIGYAQAFLKLRNIRTPESLLSFTCDGVQLGDALYDTILAKGYASINEINKSILFPVLASFFYQRAKTKQILSKYLIVSGFSTHIVGVPGAAFMRYLLQKNIVVYIRETTLKKYTSLSMMHECCATPDRRYIDYMRSRPEIFVARGESALENRLGNKNTSEIDHLAYKSGKTIYTSREEFARDFELDPAKKNVFVMLHAFNDYPHTYGTMVHQDFYHWFMNVLELAKRNREVNWIFKNHPYEQYYPTDVNVGAIFSGVADPHICYMPANVNFNTSSLCRIGDVVITCLGTAGLEYSAFGIPCILAARCWYSGLGFTREPTNLNEFENELINIARLPRLTDAQIATAKIVAYFSFEAMNQLKFPDPFRTIATFDLDEAKNFTTDEMFDAILRFRAQSTEAEKQAYMASLCEFIQDPNWTQFVDFTKHKELRDALNDQTSSECESRPEKLLLANFK
jgi:hypothetical protein